MSDASLLDEPSANARERALGDLSLAFLLDIMAGGVGGLAPRDSLLVLAINQANIAPLTRDAAARSAYGSLEAPAPDEERRPVSISAVATSLNLPFETVRRRVKGMEAQGACVVSEAGIIVPEAFLTSVPYLQTVMACHARLRDFYRAAAAQDLVEPLPASHYGVDDGIPVRGAIRLLSDYILRTADHLLKRGGDIVAALVLLGIVVVDTELRPGAAPVRRATPVTVLAARLGIPAETVRRHAARLADEGQCVRNSQGYLITAEILAQRGWATFLRGNAVNVQRLFAGLAERGVIQAWGPDLGGPSRRSTG